MAIFDNNMAVGKSENLVTLHPHDLTQPFLRGCSDLEFQNQGNAHVPVNQGCVNADGTLRFYEVCYFFMSVSHEI